MFPEKMDTSTMNEDTIPDEMTKIRTISKNKDPTPNFVEEKESCLKYFDRWKENEQLEFVQTLISHMCHYQHGQINSYLKPMLQRDFITALPKKGLDHVAEKILSYLDAKSLCAAELVCKEWRRVISDGMLWKKLIEHKVRTDSLWGGLAERRGWGRYLFRPKPGGITPNEAFFRRLYPEVIQEIENIENNWRCGHHRLDKILCHSESSKGVYCLQYDEEKIVSGLRDNTIKIWDRKTLKCLEILNGHTGSVLCLQYDERVIITGSSDSTVRVWDVKTCQMLNTLIHHCEAVLHLRFANGLMVTCSKDRSIAVWDMRSPTDINLRRVLVGHRAAVNVVDFDDKYIVSASGDRSIKVWNTSTCEFVRTLNGHRRGIACLQYRDRLVVSGSSDNTIRLWDIECGACLRILEGHEELVRCIRFDNKRIVSGAYDGKCTPIYHTKEHCLIFNSAHGIVQSSGSVKGYRYSQHGREECICCEETGVLTPRKWIGLRLQPGVMTRKKKIKVWDLQAALDPRAPAGTLCLRTLMEHTGRVFRLQFDEFQIVSSSHDDTILIWDFLPEKSSYNLNKCVDPTSDANNSNNTGNNSANTRTYTYVSK